MTNRGFTIETRGQAMAIVGEPTELTMAIIKESVSMGVHAAMIGAPEDLALLCQDYDPDYLVVFSPPGAGLAAPLQALIESGGARLSLVYHQDSDPPQPPLTPVSKRLVFSDYVGAGELVSPTITAWLSEIKQHNSFTVQGDGLGEVNLLSLSDLAKLLTLAILYPSTSPEQVLKLGNPAPISLLNLAYLVRTSLPSKIGLNFSTQTKEGSQVTPSEQYQAALDQLSHTLEGGWEQDLKFYLKSLRTSPAPESPKPPHIPPKSPISTNPEPPVKKLTPLKNFQPVFVPLRATRKISSYQLPRLNKTTPRFSGVVGRGLVIALALYLGTLAFSATLTALSLKQTLTSLQSRDLPTPSKLNSFALTYLRANWVAMTSLPPVASRPTIADLTLLLDAYSQALAAFDTAALLSRQTEDLAHYIFGGGTGDAAQLISLSRLQAEELYQQLSLLDGALPADPPSLILAKYGDSYKTGKAKLAEVKRGVITMKAILATTPDVIGLGGRRKYAILFQNNMELRATGGFIGSLGIVSFENGKLYDLAIYDVYEADGQLKGHVEPPLAIKEILGEANWYLRDSNFDPDFPTSARRAEWFIKKSLNQDVSGTIAINVNTLLALLKVTGPINLSDYNETITDTNLYERAQFHAEVNFFPGSTQKKEFLSTLSNALFAKLPNLGAGEGLKLIQALSDTIQVRDTLISLTAPTSDHVFETLGWNGRLSDYPCPALSNCHKDYAMVVDSNFGVNKANYFVNRRIEAIITFDKNLSISHTLRLAYQNTSTSSAWPAGAYKNYQRIYLPIGSTITSVKIDDRILETREYTISSEHSKLVLGYPLTVPINSNAVVEVNYSTRELPQEKELSYTWYWQKQSGTSSSDPLTVYLNYPMYLKPSVISPQAELAPQQIKFDMANDTDHRVTVKFTK